MKITRQRDPKTLKSYDCTDIEDIRSIAKKFTPTLDTVPIPPQKPQPQPKIDPEKEEDEEAHPAVSREG
jgi:hypothetical protein